MPFLKKVVVGDDQDAISHLIEAALGDAGWLCLPAHDGEAVLELVRRESLDLLILDVLMRNLSTGSRRCGASRLMPCSRRCRS